jgi:hypothetical protein
LCLIDEKEKYEVKSEIYLDCTLLFQSKRSDRHEDRQPFCP